MYISFVDLSSNLKSISLLSGRLVVAYGFYTPAMIKWENIDGVVMFFTNLGIPFPTINAYMAATTEMLGVVLLTLGFMARLISIPLIVIMVVAITTVHLGNGFSADDGGFEIPLYYMIFLLIFLSSGAGKISLDRIIFGEKN
jgi:putative oxidoreductase